MLNAKGFQSTWDRLGNISAAIDYIKKLKKKMSKAMGATYYQSTTHTNASTEHLAWRVADKARDEILQKFRKNRAGNSKIVPTLNTLQSGEQKLKSSSVASFNKKVMATKNGILVASELDDDTLPPLALSRNVVEENE